MKLSHISNIYIITKEISTSINIGILIGNNLKSFKIFLFLLLIVLGNIIIVSANYSNNYYVANWGIDTNNGSFSSPWQHPSYAALQVSAGDTIYLMNGTWYGENIVFKNSGNATHPITLTVYNGTPTLDGVDGLGTGILGGYYNGSYHHREYINISGLTIKNYQYSIYVRKSSYINIENNIVLPNYTLTNQTSPGNSPKGIYFQDDTHYSNIINNTVIGDAWNSIAVVGRYYSGGIWYSNASTNNTVINNKVSNNTLHNCIDVSGNVTDVLLQNNQIFNCNKGKNIEIGSGIYFHQGIYDRVNITGNIIFDSYAGISGTPPASLTDKIINSIIYNNTIINSSTYAVQLRNAHNITVSNNIVIKSVYEGLYLGGVNITFRRNNVTNIPTSYSEYRVYGGNPEGGSGFVSDSYEDTYKVMSSSNAPIEIYYIDGKVFSENGGNTATWYQDKSNYSLILNETVTITTYPMTARPTSDPATVTVNSFNTSLPAGQVLVNFTANTTNGNNVHFTISTLTPGRNYTIKKGSSNFMNLIAGGSGTIAFDNSVWPSSAFTVRESVEQGSGSASGTAVRMNLTPIPNANVSLYYQNGMAYGLTVRSGANGRFTFSNITNGNYYVAVDKQLYRQNISSVFNINSNSLNIGSIKAMCYDVNGDNNIDVLDLNMIGQRINEITGNSYPAVDVNGDGAVDIHDVTLVSGQIEG